MTLFLLTVNVKLLILNLASLQSDLLFVPTDPNHFLPKLFSLEQVHLKALYRIPEADEEPNS